METNPTNPAPFIPHHPACGGEDVGFGCDPQCAHAVAVAAPVETASERARRIGMDRRRRGVCVSCGSKKCRCSREDARIARAEGRAK